MSKNEHLLKNVESFLKTFENSDAKPLYEMTESEAREFLLSVQRVALNLHGIKHPL